MQFSSLPDETDVVGSKIRWDLIYDLNEEDFRFGPEGSEQECIPTQSLLDSVSLLQHQRTLSERANGETLVRRADRIANAFRNYKIPVIPILGNNLEDATKAFQRINSTGTPMSDVHMVAALSYSKEFDLNRRLDELGSSLDEVGWGGLDRKYILATVRAACGLEISSPKAEQLSAKLKSQLGLLPEAIENLKKAARFLNDECNIPSPTFLPYSYQAVFLAEAFRTNSEPSPQIKSGLRDWLWRTSYSGFFLGARSTQMIKALDLIHAMAKGEAQEEPAWDPVDALPRRFDLHSARAKCLAVRLTELMMKCNLIKKMTPMDVLRTYGSSAFMQLVTKAETQTPGIQFSGPENRALSAPEDWQSDRLILLSPLLADDETDRAQAISSDTRAALNNRNFDRFLRLRRRAIIQLEKQFVDSLGLKYAISNEDLRDIGS